MPLDRIIKLTLTKTETLMMTGWKKVLILAALAGGSVSAAPIRGTGAGHCAAEGGIEANKLIPVEFVAGTTLQEETMSRKDADSDGDELSPALDPEQDFVGSEPSFPGMR